MTKEDFFEKIQPHTLLKLNVLKHYLDAYAEIIGRVFTSVAFVDPYAGIGKYEGNIEGSPLILCQAAKRMLEIEGGKTKKVQYLGNELNSEHLEELSKNLENFKDITKLFNMDGKDFLKECLNKYIYDFSKALFFVDPFDYGYLKEDIDHIFEMCGNTYMTRCSCEVILFLPTSHVYRFKTLTQYQKINNFINSYGIEIKKDTSPQKFIEKIRQNIQNSGKYCASVELEEKSNTYALFFIGNNLYGVEKFLEARDACVRKNVQLSLFSSPDSIDYKLMQELEKNTLLNTELYEWALKNNFSIKQLKDFLKQKTVREFVNCKGSSNAYYVDYDHYRGKKNEQVRFSLRR